MGALFWSKFYLACVFKANISQGDRVPGADDDDSADSRDNKKF